MNKSRRPPLVNFLYRLVLCLPFWLIGWRFIAMAQDWSDVLQIIAGVIILLLPPAGILASPMAGFAAQIGRGRLHPGVGDTSPVPAHSIPKAYRARGEFARAMDAYREMVAQFPQELRAWEAMLQIAVSDLKDLDLAHAIARQALATLEAPQDKARFRSEYMELTGPCGPVA